MTTLPAVFFAAIAIGLVVGLVVLLVLQIITSWRVQRITSPLYEYAEAKSQAEADRIVNDARERARAIITEAEAKAHELLDEQRKDIATRTEEFHGTLSALAASVEKNLEEQSAAARGEEQRVSEESVRAIQASGAALISHAEKAGAEFDVLLRDAKSKLEEIEKGVPEALARATAGIAEAFQTAGKTGAKDLEAKLASLVAEARVEVESYRESRKKLIDAHIADLVVDVTKVVLQKTLTPDEHLALVERALNEARAAGML